MKLIFVYNANSGGLNALLDGVHKIVSPSTYECSLCAITYGNFREDDLWKTFRENSEMDMVFLHKDEFLKRYKSKWLPKYSFPIVLTEFDHKLEVFFTPENLDEMSSSEDLIEAINARLKSFS